MKYRIDWKPDRDPEQVVQIVFLVITLSLKDKFGRGGNA